MKIDENILLKIVQDNEKKYLGIYNVLFHTTSITIKRIDKIKIKYNRKIDFTMIGNIKHQNKTVLIDHVMPPAAYITIEEYNKYNRVNKIKMILDENR